MGRKLSTMTSAQLKAEMSIAGSPDKLMDMRERILGIMAEVNDKNPAELINLELLMERLLAESRTWMKLYGQRTGQKIYISRGKYI